MVDIISNEKRQADDADTIVMRTHEVYEYDRNIENYASMLTTLPTDSWPADLAHLQGLAGHEAAAMCAPDRVQVLATYQLRDQIAALHKSEQVERAKAAALLDVANARLTGPGRDAALQAAVDRREAAINAVRP